MNAPRNLKHHFTELEEKGFSIVPNVIGAKDVVQLKTDLGRAIKDDMEEFGGLPGKQENLVVDMVRRGRSFVELLENPVMHQLFSHVLGDTCTLYSYTSTVMNPTEKPAASRIHVDSPNRYIEGYETGMLMTLALDDFTEENGATYYLAGSHKSEAMPSEEEFYAKSVRVARKAGDAVFFSNRVYHAGGLNTTRQVRHAVTIYACRSFMKQRFDYPRLVNDKILSYLGEKGRSFLGFNVRVPTGCHEYYVPVDQRLYKANQG